MHPTEMQRTTDTKLKRIAWLSSQDPHKQFDCLMHHFNADSLEACFHPLKGRKAVGIDGVTKAEYAQGLDENIQDLVARMQRMAYRPEPVRQVRIPKEGQPQATRPLGISTLEDKIVQKMMHRVLESIYEPLFLDCSYGFRPGRGCHDAIRALHQHLFRYKVQTVIDVDLAGYFDSIDHQLLESILRKKIRDERFLRYLHRMFKAGVLAQGECTVSEEGVPQGSICSPILANIFAHEVIDTWIEEMVKPHCAGRVALFRYADDLVICCQYNRDAQRIRRALPKRLAKYKLRLNEEKTQMIFFSKRAYWQHRSASFDFLGFTFYLSPSHRGDIIPKLKSQGKRFRAKLKRVNEWARQVRCQEKLPVIWRRFCTKLRGHIRYYGVSFNSDWVEKFIQIATRILFKWLNRRSQRKSFTWEQFNRFIRANPLPRTKVYHPLF
ncbi:MAG: group II intron reverse transcriptase/maturase [Gemmatimonadetes bacterium]|nr:group II intron reverse transcriptase/maturase [Gemmatimonadota bacterium]